MSVTVISTPTEVGSTPKKGKTCETTMMACAPAPTKWRVDQRRKSRQREGRDRDMKREKEKKKEKKTT